MCIRCVINYCDGVKVNKLSSLLRMKEKNRVLQDSEMIFYNIWRRPFVIHEISLTAGVFTWHTTSTPPTMASLRPDMFSMMAPAILA